MEQGASVVRTGAAHELLGSDFCCRFEEFASNGANICPLDIELKWMTEVSSSVYATPLITDLYADGRKDIVVPGVSAHQISVHHDDDFQHQVPAQLLQRQHCATFQAHIRHEVMHASTVCDMQAADTLCICCTSACVQRQSCGCAPAYCVLMSCRFFALH
jgi:hypothetical protein